LTKRNEFNVGGQNGAVADEVGGQFRTFIGKETNITPRVRGRRIF